jgi:hypothetical protein
MYIDPAPSSPRALAWEKTFYGICANQRAILMELRSVRALVKILTSHQALLEELQNMRSQIGRLQTLLTSAISK